MKLLIALSNISSEGFPKVFGVVRSSYTAGIA